MKRRFHAIGSKLLTVRNLAIETGDAENITLNITFGISASAHA
jgi:hypothetical protein